MKRTVKLFVLAAVTAAFAAPVAHSDVYASATWNGLKADHGSWNHVIGYGSTWSPMKSAPWLSGIMPMKSGRIGVNDAYRLFIGI